MFPDVIVPRRGLLTRYGGKLSRRDLQRGALYGLAIGDALGAAVEFQEPGTFEPVTGGPHGLDLGEWTDDTSMALALADSIGKYGWDLDDQMNRYIDWQQNGSYSVNGWCFDIGSGTARSLDEYSRHQNVRTCSDPCPSNSGNGSIMRLAPVVIKYFDEPDKYRESSITTHASEQCQSACVYMGMVLSAFIKGEYRENVLTDEWLYSKNLSLDENILAVARGSYTSQIIEIKGSGWVVESLEAALWAFSTSSCFEEAVLKAVNLGHDADTTGAVCGQLAGAYWGESGIPESLMTGLAKKEMIEEALSRLEI